MEKRIGKLFDLLRQANQMDDDDILTVFGIDKTKAISNIIDALETAIANMVTGR